jgi:hypothetical protein
LTFFLIGYGLTCVIIIVEKSFSQEEPSGDEPHEIKNPEGFELI